METSASAAISALSNIGPSLREFGAFGNYSVLPGYVKVTLSFCMIAGRLEIFTLLIILLPGFWRR